jgi:hypothetical protein
VAFGKVLAEGGARVLDRLRGRTVLYLHLAEEALATQAGAHPGSRVARAEGLGPLSLPQLREWLGTDTVVVRPVLDPAGLTPVDSYEIPRDLAEALTLRDPFEVFPWGTLGSRHADCDHTKPYRPPGAPGDDGGPPGQTGLHNLGPLARTHHRAKTFGGFACYQPVPGLYFWRLPSGHWYQVDHTGTYALGRAAPPILEAQDPRHGSSAMRRLDAHFAERIDFALAT